MDLVKLDVGGVCDGGGGGEFPELNIDRELCKMPLKCPTQRLRKPT